jgi:hypothetical protein
MRLSNLRALLGKQQGKPLGYRNGHHHGGFRLKIVP